jgi:3-oxoacyl-(acyl-carrier-protein) synthase
MCVAAAAEAPLTPSVIASLSRTGELSSETDDPDLSCTPFDRRRSGMVLSEGSCVLILEEREAAQRRNASIYATVRGAAQSSDGLGLFGLDETGEVAARSIRRMLTETGTPGDSIDYVCSHANSSAKFDVKEARVLKQAFGPFVTSVQVSSIKGVIGHPIAAAGIFQIAATCLAARDGIVPPTANLEDVDADCDLSHVSKVARRMPVRRAIVTSYGYGGVNACVLLDGAGTGHSEGR